MAPCQIQQSHRGSPFGQHPDCSRTPFPGARSPAVRQRRHMFRLQDRTQQRRDTGHPVSLGRLPFCCRPGSRSRHLDWSVKTSEIGSFPGHDAGMKIKDRNRHMVGDTEVSPMVLQVLRADTRDRDCARRTLDSFEGGARHGEMTGWCPECCMTCRQRCRTPGIRIVARGTHVRQSRCCRDDQAPMCAVSPRISMAILAQASASESASWWSSGMPR